MKRIISVGLVLFLTSLGLACQQEKETSIRKVEEATYTNISVQELHEMLPEKDFTLINVHIPYAGEIQKTDLFIPYNEIEQNADKLPEDKNAKLVLYCRSGSMSATAVQDLVKLGYTHVFDVQGGMRAWQAAGYELINEPK